MEFAINNASKELVNLANAQSQQVEKMQEGILTKRFFYVYRFKDKEENGNILYQ